MCRIGGAIFPGRRRDEISFAVIINGHVTRRVNHPRSCAFRKKGVRDARARAKKITTPNANTSANRALSAPRERAMRGVE